MKREMHPDRLKMHQEWISYAIEVSKRSDDLHTQTGCALVYGDRLIAAEPNGLPYRVFAMADRLERPEKYKWIEHAERNAIYAAARKGTATEFCTAYLPWFPCVDCARALVQVGVRELVCYEPNMDDERWGEDFLRAHVILTEGKVEITYIDKVNQHVQ